MTIYTPLRCPARLYIKQCSHCNLKYFGKTSREDIQNYRGSGKYWTRHLNKYNATQIHLWNSDWYQDTSIIRFATKFSNMNNIVESLEWANLATENGIDGGHLGEDVYRKISRNVKQTVNDPEWKMTVGKEKSRKQTDTINDNEWKATVGKEKNKKLSEWYKDENWSKAKTEKQKRTKSSAEWKATVGKNAGAKISDIKNSQEWKETIGLDASKKRLDTMNDPEWKTTTGKIMSEKISRGVKQTMNDPEWKSTIGAERSRKQSETLLDPDWRARNYKTCPHCNKNVSPAVYGRLHGERCKLKSP